MHKPLGLIPGLRTLTFLIFTHARLHQAAMTEDREQYTALMGVADEKAWCRQGGVAKDYALAAAVFETIDEDVNRTNVEDSAERERVRRVLRAFALKNPSTGYCQVRVTTQNGCLLCETQDSRKGTISPCCKLDSTFAPHMCLSCFRE